MNLIEKMLVVEQTFETELNQAADLQQVEALRIQLFGKKGKITEILQELKNLTEAERPLLGQQLNEIKQKIQKKLDNYEEEKRSEARKITLLNEKIDISLPGQRRDLGVSHLISRTLQQIIDIFWDLGFELGVGPDIENDFYNFEALNMPAEHPARDMWDTFYLEKGFLLRTHTSPVQIRCMQKQKPPLRVIGYGKVFRRDDDMTHAPVFHQVEGLAVDRDLDFAQLKGILFAFLDRIFEGKVKDIRLRPSFFPFTEPSAEVDVKWENGWLEVLGCGMVDPQVLKAVAVDSEEFRGYAFGLGVERIAMIKYGIQDIRLFQQNDLRFLKQF